jgi:hypothetical protein
MSIRATPKLFIFKRNLSIVSEPGKVYYFLLINSQLPQNSWLPRNLSLVLLGKTVPLQLKDGKFNVGRGLSNLRSNRKRW